MKLSRLGTKLAFFMVLLSALSSWFVQSRLAQVHNVDLQIESIPYELDGWVGQDAGEMETRSLGILQLNRYIKRTYRAPEKLPAFIYIGYWEKQTGDFQAAKHSPNLCLPGNGWKIERLGKIELSLKNGKRLPVSRLIADFDRKKSLVYYLFFNGTDYYTEEWQSLLRISYSALLGKRTDGGIVEVFVPITQPGGIEDAERTMETFLGSALDELDKLVSK